MYSSPRGERNRLFPAPARSQKPNAGRKTDMTPHPHRPPAPPNWLRSATLFEATFGYVPQPEGQAGTGRGSGNLRTTPECPPAHVEKLPTGGPLRQIGFVPQLCPRPQLASFRNLNRRPRPDNRAGAFLHVGARRQPGRRLAGICGRRSLSGCRISAEGAPKRWTKKETGGRRATSLPGKPQTAATSWPLSRSSGIRPLHLGPPHAKAIA